MEKLKFVVHELFASGLEDQSTAPGLHRTSWEAINQLLMTGRLPASNSKNVDEFNHPAGRVYFHLTKKALPHHPLARTFLDTEKEVMEAVAGYAEDIAKIHGFIQTLGLEIHDRNLSSNRSAANQTKRQKSIRSIERYFADVGESEFYTYLRDLNVSDEQLRSALDIARTRKGIVLSIRHSVRNALEIAEGDKDNGDLSILCPDGLPVEYISGLKPMGDFEYDQLDALGEE